MRADLRIQPSCSEWSDEINAREKDLDPLLVRKVERALSNEEI